MISNQNFQIMSVAIIDLGTNTFNLLIAEKDEIRPFKILYNKKIPVKLGEKRINDSEIIPAAYQRGIEAIQKHFETIQSFKVSRIRAFGTSALRTAKNGDQFLNEIKSLTGIEVEIISGEREAELIYKGVAETIELSALPIVILDIGGGSNELIIANNQGIIWKRSYPLGIARLIARFTPSNPLTAAEVKVIETFLGNELQDLFDQLKKHTVKTLVGASGSFETFTAMIAERDWELESTKEATAEEINIEKFESLFQKLIYSTTAERELMKGLEPMRIEMIVLAALFVKFVTQNAGIKSMYQSAFALKEGAVVEIIN